MPADREPLSLSAVPVATLVRLLRGGGSQHASPEALERDRAAGAPITEDGKVDLVAYTAWLVKDLADGT